MGHCLRVLGSNKIPLWVIWFERILLATPKNAVWHRPSIGTSLRLCKSILTTPKHTLKIHLSFYSNQGIAEQNGIMIHGFNRSVTILQYEIWWTFASSQHSKTFVSITERFKNSQPYSLLNKHEMLQQNFTRPSVPQWLIVTAFTRRCRVRIPLSRNIAVNTRRLPEAGHRNDCNIQLKRRRAMASKRLGAKLVPSPV